jgi:tetratricopeptide (TPR) repeat protein
VTASPPDDRRARPTPRPAKLPDSGSSASLRRPTATAAPGRDDELEQLLAEGADLYAKGQLEEAHGKLSQAHRRRAADPRCLAWYGLTLIVVERNSNLGVRYCEEAVRGAGADDPVCWLNLARAFLALGYRERAIHTLERGLEIVPGQPALREEIDKLGVRWQPVLGFLDRSNPVNRMLGRLRHRMLRGSSTPR